MTDIYPCIKELAAGLRLEGASIDECCRMWGLTREEYNEYCKEYPEFKRAHDLGERDFRIFLMEKFRENLNNAQVLKLALGEHLGWSDKKQHSVDADEPIKKVEIEVLRPEPREITDNTNKATE